MLIVAGKSTRTPAGSIQQGEIRETKALSEILRMLLKPYLSKVDVLCSVGMPSLVNRQLILPWVKKREFEALISLQVERMLADSLRSYLIDYRVNRIFMEDGAEKAAVTVFAVPRRIIEGYSSLFEQTGITPYTLDAQPNCISKLFGGDFGHGANENENSFALIDMGYSMTGVHIMDKGSLAFSRVLSTGLNAVDEAIMKYYQISYDEAERLKQVQADFKSELPEIITLNRVIEEKLDPVAAEIQRVFRFYTSKNPKKTLEKAYIYGGLSHIKNVDYYLTGILNCPVELPGSFRNISLPSELENDNVRDYLNCLGTLIREDMNVNRKELAHHA
jgi:type IV pilus assembly protein PilM